MNTLWKGQTVSFTDRDGETIFCESGTQQVVSLARLWNSIRSDIGCALLVIFWAIVSPCIAFTIVWLFRLLFYGE